MCYNLHTHSAKDDVIRFDIGLKEIGDRSMREDHINRIARDASHLQQNSKDTDPGEVSLLFAGIKNLSKGSQPIELIKRIPHNLPHALKDR